MKFDQETRLVLAQNLIQMVKEIRSMPESEIIGHLVGFYVFTVQETDGTLDNAIEAVKRTWETPQVENDNGPGV